MPRASRTFVATPSSHTFQDVQADIGSLRYLLEKVEKSRYITTGYFESRYSPTVNWRERVNDISELVRWKWRHGVRATQEDWTWFWQGFRWVSDPVFNAKAGQRYPIEELIPRLTVPDDRGDAALREEAAEEVRQAQVDQMEKWAAATETAERELKKSIWECLDAWEEIARKYKDHLTGRTRNDYGEQALSTHGPHAATTDYGIVESSLTLSGATQSNLFQSRLAGPAVYGRPQYPRAPGDIRNALEQARRLWHARQASILPENRSRTTAQSELRDRDTLAWRGPSIEAAPSEPENTVDVATVSWGQNTR